MSAWGDSELLVELLDRQFKFLLDLGGTAQIIRLPRLLSFLQTEPQLVGLLEDLRAEASRELQEYDAADAKVRGELGRLWELHGAEIRQRLEGVTEGALHAYWPMDRFEPGLKETKPAAFASGSDGIESATEKLVRAFHHWWKWTSDLVGKGGEPLTGEYAELGKRLNRLLAVHEHAARRLNEKGGALAWPAYERLVSNATVTNPVPPDPTDDLAWATFPMATDFATALRRADVEGTNYVEALGVDDVYEEIAAGARLLHEELRLRIGLVRSRSALVHRYAARCEAFDAERLRDACEKEPGRAERLLTLDLARYLFDAGLPPLIDANVGGLRPDVLHILPSSMFYVEAKQYANDHPRSQLTKAYAQVWSTWARLRKTYAASEAFVVVFRRSGPWVDLPSVIHHQGLRLYSVVADISTEAGSKEKSSPIRLTEDELRPKDEVA